MYFVIEHKAQGCFVGFDSHRSSGQLVPRFRRAIPRDDFEVRRFAERVQAERELDRISKTVTRCYLVPMTD